MTLESENYNCSSSNASATATDLRIFVAGFEFKARFEEAAAPCTCSYFRKLLPLKGKMIHCRWSGEGVWIPMNRWEFSWRAENSKISPAPGQVLLYAGGELAIPYGPCIFYNKSGVMSGSHFLTIEQDLDLLTKLGKRLRKEAVMDCTIG